MSPLESLLWAALGGLWALAGIAALRFATTAGRADQTARDERQRQVAAAILTPDHDLVTDGEFDLKRGCCEDCDAELDAMEAAGRELVGELTGWLRDETEGVRPPVVPGPEDADR